LNLAVSFEENQRYKEVDLGRMADMTKVSKTYLQYIEDEEFKKLPAPVYVRGSFFSTPRF